jgi:hypothetical protein
MAVIPFMEETWFVWWIIAVVVILRWFHLSSLSRTETAEMPASEEPEDTTTSIVSGPALL